VLTRRLVWGGVAIALLLTVSGCSSGADGPAAASTTATPSTVPPPPPPTTDPTGVAAVQEYFLRDGVLAAGEARLVPGPDLAARALDVLVAGPSDADEAAGLTTAISPKVVVNSLTVEGDNISVDFNRAFETADTQPQTGQVVYTLTQFAGIRTVTFLIDGQPNGATGVTPLDRTKVRRDLVPVG
jgi:Sporulation and spore germination